jgi:hypothetical protein
MNLLPYVVTFLKPGGDFKETFILNYLYNNCEELCIDVVKFR